MHGLQKYFTSIASDEPMLRELKNAGGPFFLKGPKMLKKHNNTPASKIFFQV